MIVRRFRTVVVASLSVAIVVFCVYSIPTYFQLLAHQPDRNPTDATSFPPESAFFMGGIVAAISFALVFLVLLTVWAISRRGDLAKNIEGQGTRII
jgi:Kef-type K+ transport system membrane component KefB